ncbi:MAG: DUF1491 family protein [Hyphomicrobiales bacterium]
MWVAAYLRRCASEGAFAALRRRGAAEAGAVFIKIDPLNGRAALLGPAPASPEERSGERWFERLIEEGSSEEIEARMIKEIGFDTDLWYVEVENRTGLPFVDELEN